MLPKCFCAIFVINCTMTYVINPEILCYFCFKQLSWKKKPQLNCRTVLGLQKNCEDYIEGPHPPHSISLTINLSHPHGTFIPINEPV